MKFSIHNYSILIVDFDGVLTDNKVMVDDAGREAVLCSRADGLAFDVLSKIGFPAIIFSSERSSVVSFRAKKIGVSVFSAVENKLNALSSMALENSWDLSKVIYVGNDINDFLAMKLCGLRVCPSDSHHSVKHISHLVLKAKGGDGVIRELLEDCFDLDFLEVLYGADK